MLPLFRSDAPEECYFTFTYSPIRDESGGVGGVFCAVLETTDKIIEERRLRLLNALADATARRRRATRVRSPPRSCRAHRATCRSRCCICRRAIGSRSARRAARTSSQVLRSRRPRSRWAIVRSGRSTVAAEFRATLELEAGPDGARGAVILPIERAGGGPPLGFIVAGLSPLLRSSRVVRPLPQPAGGEHLAGREQRRRLRSRAPARRSARRARSREDHVLQQRQPRVPHAADADAGADPGHARATPPDAPIDRASVELLHRNALRLLKLVNTLLEFSRIEAGRVEAVYEPVDLAALTADLASSFRAAIERAGLALVVDCPPLAGADLRRSRHVGEDRPQPALERVQVHVRGRDRASALRVDGWQRRARQSPTRAPGIAAPSCRACSSVFTASKARARAATKAPASASRWFRSSCVCTAATSRSRASSASAPRSKCASRAARHICPPIASAAARTLAVDDVGGHRGLRREAMRWGPQRRSDRCRDRVAGAARAHRVRRRQRRHARVRRAPVGRALERRDRRRWRGRARRDPARAAGPRVVRRHDAGARRLRARPGAPRRSTRCARFRSSCCRRARAKRRPPRA